MQTLQGKHIYVGLSGGVDSAVSAARLKASGARVQGVFIKGWYPPGMPCTWASDRRDAMRVAAHLAIPFTTLDASAEYKASVIDYLLREYAVGRTPNPDIMCNREVKFGAFYRFAKEQGADAIATGHYVDGEKDQRYFLWAVPQTILAETIFPLRGLQKSAVRAYARTHDLPVAHKPDSQGVCFLGDVSIEDFLRAECKPTPGLAVTEEGVTIGTHKGAVLYTLGERIAIDNASVQGPWYVVSKDMRTNTLCVSRTRTPRETHGSVQIHFSQANWHQASESAHTAQYRYRGPRVKGRLVSTSFTPSEPLPEPAPPGQSIVFYDEKDNLVGGGVIN